MSEKKLVTVPRILIGACVLLAGVYFAGPRVRLDPRIETPELPVAAAELEAHIAREEARYSDLTPGTEKRIVWRTPARTRTKLALVYVHGFGASRQELAPVAERLARKLGANLFETRLRGHGRGLALGAAKSGEWLQDTEEAYRVGLRLGEQVIFLAMSTGSPLVLSITDRYAGKDIAGLALLSPNFHPKDASAGLLSMPWGLQLARAVQGEYYEWEPRNEQMARYFTTRHKIEALVEMMALVDYADDIELEEIKVPTILIYTKKDQVIDPARVEAAFSRFGSERKELVDLPGGTMHNIASDLLAPENVDPVVALMENFFTAEQ